jgi:polyhydroxyalkanoate synthesis regulator phasin
MVQKLAPTLITPWLDANFKFPDIKKNMLDKAQKKCQTVQNYDDLCKLIENMKFHADMYNAERKDFNDDAMFYIKNQNKELYEDKEKLSAIISKLNPIFEKYYYEQLVTSESHEQVKANYLAKAHSVVNTLLQSNISKEQTNKGWNLETFIESFHKKTK